jgi:hypothetical protein
LTLADANIGLAKAQAEGFTVSGLEPDDKGTVTFNTPSGPVLVQIVNGVPVSSTVNLSGPVDGSVTATLFVQDAAGNTFTANASATLDQDATEQAQLSLTVNNGSTATISGPGLDSVPFTVAGLDSEDTGTVTFTDVDNKTVTVAVSGGPTSYSADLSTLANGPIRSSLAVDPVTGANQGGTDTAGNSFTPVSGNEVTLRGRIVWARAVNGDWNDFTKWSPTVVPGAADDAFIEVAARRGSGYTVTSSASNTVGSLTIGRTAATLDIARGVFTLVNASSNGGTIKVEGAPTARGLNVAAAPTLDVLNTLTNSGLVTATGRGAFIDLSGGTLSGGGVDVAPSALLAADGGPSSPSTIDGGAVVTDGGTIPATNHTTLTLADTTINAVITRDWTGKIVGGILTAGEGLPNPGAPSTIALAGATINGGVLRTTNTGQFMAQAGTDSTLNGVTISANSLVQVADEAFLTLQGTIDNSGRINLLPGVVFNSALLVISGQVTLNGTAGNISLAAGIVSDGLPATLTNEGNTIIGSGDIGNFDATLTLNNNGTGNIEASGGTLFVDTHNTVTNQGTMGAEGGGTLVIDDDVNNAGLIDSQDLLDDVVINAKIANTGNGTVTAGFLAPRGLVELHSQSEITGGRVDVYSTLEADDGGTATIAGARIADAGTLEAINHTLLKLSNDTIDALFGTILAADPDGFGGSAAEVLLSGATIHSGTLKEEQDGAIKTDPGTTSTLDGDGTRNNVNPVFIDSGTTVEVVANSTLALEGGIDNSGKLVVDSNGTLTIGGGQTATLIGGTLWAQGGRVRTVAGPTILISDATIIGGPVEVSARTTLTLEDTFATLGQITVDANGILTLGLGATLMLETLSAQPGGRIRTIAGTSSKIEDSTIAAGATVEVVAGSTLILDGSIVNAGNIVVDQGATLTLFGNTLLTDAGTITLAGGQITSSAPAGQTYTLSDGEVDGAGAVNTIQGYGMIGTGDGRLQLSGSDITTFNANGIKPLVIDTGHDVGNVSGGFTFEATGRGGLTILDYAGGLFKAQGGNITVQGATGTGSLGDPCEIFSGHRVEFKTPVSEVIAEFQNNAGDSGRLILDQNASFEFQPPFAALLQGFSGTVFGSDVVDLRDINSAQASWTYTQDVTAGGVSPKGALDVTDGNGYSVRLELLGQYLAAGSSASGSGTDSTLFQLSPDGQGGTLVVTGSHP